MSINKTYRKGATGALLDEYERSINELQQVINEVSDEELIQIADGKTPDPNCKSIQTILAHVVRSGFSYATYIHHLKGNEIDFRTLIFHTSVKDYQTDLNSVFDFTVDTFIEITDDELEHFNDGKKIMTRWKEEYTIEQIMEHAIVHILRHRRQIERFKMIVQGK